MHKAGLRNSEEKDTAPLVGSMEVWEGGSLACKSNLGSPAGA